MLWSAVSRVVGAHFAGVSAAIRMATPYVRMSTLSTSSSPAHDRLVQFERGMD